jgi:disulfide bond formation protein DsbB
MTSQHKQRFPYLAASIFVLVILGTYLGAYYALVATSLVLDSPTSVGDVIARAEPTYSWGGRLSATLFRPANALDRLLRPQEWCNRELRVISPLEEAPSHPTSAAKR